VKVCFFADHHTYGGLNNNGGSQTILKSVMTLRTLGHTANVVSRVDRFTLFKHPKPIRSIPEDTEVCIAVSASDIKPMLARMPKKAKAYWWCRLLENYSMPKAKIVKYASKVKLLVNSEGLRDWFKKHGVGSKVVYQGVDIEDWEFDTWRSDKKTVGFLISNKARKNFKVVKGIVETLGDEYGYIGYGTKGDQDKRTVAFTKRRFSYFGTDLPHSAVSDAYNMAHIWCATSTKEGLHNCPVEAALCGCAVVYPDALLGGCSDHCIDGETAWAYKARNVEDACRAIREASRTRNEAHRNLVIEKIGDRSTAMARLVKVCSR